MARIQQTLTQLRGKDGDYVYVNSKHGAYARKTVTPGTKKNEPALKEQYIRAAYLNKLAGELNSTIREHCKSFKPGQLYQNMLKQFRKEPLNNRFLLLKQLEGMDINPRYPFSKLGHCDTRVRKTKNNRIIISLTCLHHPDKGSHHADCYYYDLLLLTWAGKKQTVLPDRQLSDWIELKEELPEFDFNFRCPASTTNWLLCLRQRLGVKQTDIESFEAEGMVVKEAGSFDKKEWVMLERNKEKISTRDTTKRQAVKMIRVKAKGKRQ